MLGGSFTASIESTSSIVNGRQGWKPCTSASRVANLKVLARDLAVLDLFGGKRNWPCRFSDQTIPCWWSSTPQRACISQGSERPTSATCLEGPKQSAPTTSPDAQRTQPWNDLCDWIPGGFGVPSANLWPVPCQLFLPVKLMSDQARAPQLQYAKRTSLLPSRPQSG